MGDVIVEAATLQKLRQVQTTVKLVDAEGKCIGHFIPAVNPLPKEPEISEAEIERRIAKGGGRRLPEIIADLERRK